MFNKDLLYKLLAVSALIALGIYIIACRPSWSPDSSKVAYVYRYQFPDSKGGGAGFAVYDVAGEKNLPILDLYMDNEVKENLSSDDIWMDNIKESFFDEGNEIVPCEAIWLSHGHEIIVIGQSKILNPDSNDNNETSKIHIQKYNITDKILTPIIKFEAKISHGILGAYPILLQDNRWLWIYAGEEKYKIDIRNKKVKRYEKKEPSKLVQKAAKYIPLLKNEDKGNTLLFQNKNDMFFVRDEGTSGTKVFGKFHPNFMFKQNDYFKVKKEDESDIIPILATTSNGDRFAYIIEKKDGSVFKVVNKNGNEYYSLKFPSDYKFSKDDDSSRIYTEWNSAGNKTWIPAIMKKEEKEYYVLVEVDTNKSEDSHKIITISPIKDSASEIETDMLFYSQISISPDDKYLSFVIFYDKKKINGEELDDPMSLCIVDLTKEEREVKIVDPPINLNYKIIEEKKAEK